MIKITALVSGEVENFFPACLYNLHTSRVALYATQDMNDVVKPKALASMCAGDVSQDTITFFAKKNDIPFQVTIESDEFVLYITALQGEPQGDIPFYMICMLDLTKNFFLGYISSNGIITDEILSSVVY